MTVKLHVMHKFNYIGIFCSLKMFEHYHFLILLYDLIAVVEFFILFFRIAILKELTHTH